MGDATIREGPAMAKTAAFAMRSCLNMGRGVLGGWGRMKAMYLKSTTCWGVYDLHMLENLKCAHL
jgi:hypothetical protein